MAFWERSELSEMDGEGLFVPKMHAVLHMLASILLYGAVDNARLGDQEKDHQPYVKKAVRRTEQHDSTFEDEVLGVADRIDAMLQIRSDERAPFCAWPARRAHVPPKPPQPFAHSNFRPYRDNNDRNPVPTQATHVWPMAALLLTY